MTLSAFFIQEKRLFFIFFSVCRCFYADFLQNAENTMANALLPNKMHAHNFSVCYFAIGWANGKYSTRHYSTLGVEFTRQERVGHSIFINFQQKPHKSIDKRWRKRRKSLFPAWKNTPSVICAVRSILNIFPNNFSLLRVLARADRTAILLLCDGLLPFWTRRYKTLHFLYFLVWFWNMAI